MKKFNKKKKKIQKKKKKNLVRTRHFDRYFAFHRVAMFERQLDRVALVVGE